MKLIKWLLWLLLFLVVVAIGGAIFLVNKVDPNSLKPQISQQVKSATGRDLELVGDLSWRFYPWVGVTMNDFSLSNREGFLPPTMLQAEHADVQVKLLPLISKQLEIGKIKLMAPKLNLSINAQGETSWGDLAGDAPTKSANPEQAAGAMLGGLLIQGVDVENGQISWNDQQAGQHYQLSDFNLTTGTIKPGEPVVFDLEGKVKSDILPDVAEMKLNGALWVSEAMDEFTLDSLRGVLGMNQINAEADIVSLGFKPNTGKLVANNIQATASDEGMSGNLKLTSLNFDLNSGDVLVDKLTGELAMDQLSANLDADSLTYGLNSGQASAAKLVYNGQYELFPFQGESRDVSYDVNTSTLAVANQSVTSKFNDVPLALVGEQLQVDLKAQTLSTPKLNINLDDAQISADIKATDILGNLSASGHLASNQFNPRALLENLGLDMLNDMPPTAMQSVILETDFKGGLNDIALDKLNARFDDSTLTGQFSMRDFSQPAYRFDLDLDQINVDQYLSEENQEVAEQTGPAAAVALPFASLKGLDVKGEIGVSELRMQELISNDVVVKMDTAADRIQVAPLKARVYGGETTNDVIYDISGDTPKVNIASTLTSLHLGPFLQAMQMTDRVDGFGNVSAQLGSAGLNADNMIANLSGEVDIDLNDGAIRGANIQKSITQAAGLYKQLKGKDLDLETEVDDETAFSSLSSHIKVNQGVLSTDDINLKAPGLRVTGGGKVDLNTEGLDLQLEVAVVETLEGQGGRAVEDLKGETIPLKISGTLSSPRIFPDFSHLLKREVERKLSEKYLGGKKLSGEEFEKSAREKLNEKLAEKLGIEQQPEWPDDEGAAKDTEWPDDEGRATTESQQAEGELLDIEKPQVAEPEPEPQDLEDQLKEKLKGKLLDKLFGN